MLKRLFVPLFLLAALAAFAPPRQTPENTAVAMSVSAGYDGSFRENMWLPIYIRLANDGPNLTGRLVVRPETSGAGFINSYSLPIDLPSGSRKADFLYVTAQTFASEVRVELLADDGRVVASEPAALRPIQPRDQLHIVLTQNASTALDFTGVNDAGYVSFQTNWRTDNLPDQAEALTPVNTLVFSDIDTGSLSTNQRAAIADWVARGGHLLVTGGANWQSTAAGLRDLLPFTPDDSLTLADLAPLADWLRLDRTALREQTIIATGSLAPEGRVLVAAEDDTPLLVRRSYGLGTVDYLTADPHAQPLRGWGGLRELWLTLASSVAPQPPWRYGVQDWESAQGTADIMPGIDLLPDILPLTLFLLAYIGLVGPLNYLVLNRFNRRELAWVTIPAFILLFSGLAWALGFTLRGSETTLGRVAVVQSWPDHDRAQVNQIVGLLSPRRAQYSLGLLETGFLRPVPQANPQTGLFTGGARGIANIEQGGLFRAVNFPADASVITAFEASATIPRPPLSGQVTLLNAADGSPTLRGAITNNTAETLQDPVLLVRGQAILLGEDLAPGTVVPFEVTLSVSELPSPAPLAYPDNAFSVFTTRSFRSSIRTESRTIQDILTTAIGERPNTGAQRSTTLAQEFLRRQNLLETYIQEPFRQLTGRGAGVYLAAWSDQAPLELTLEGGEGRTLDTTLFLAELPVTFERPSGQVRITADQFTWFVQSRTTAGDVAPLFLSLNPGDEATFRFTPLPEAMLDEVEALALWVDRRLNNGRSVLLQLWNWRAQTWEEFTVISAQETLIDAPARFIGPQNAVQVRLQADSFTGLPRIEDLTIEQIGRF